METRLTGGGAAPWKSFYFERKKKEGGRRLFSLSTPEGLPGKGRATHLKKEGGCAGGQRVPPRRKKRTTPPHGQFRKEKLILTVTLLSKRKKKRRGIERREPSHVVTWVTGGGGTLQEEEGPSAIPALSVTRGGKGKEKRRALMLDVAFDPFKKERRGKENRGLPTGAGERRERGKGETMFCSSYFSADRSRRGRKAGGGTFPSSYSV